MSDAKPTTSAFRRLTRLGGLAGRVGASVLAERVRDLARDDLARQEGRTEALIRNATRVVETLGELKGAAMKVGQMLSLHEGLLPPEVAAVLQALQKGAPRVPFEVMEYEIRGQLPDFDDIFDHLEPRAFAAASIGQVHRAWLRDGRKAAVKIQYPAIDHIIRADLKNLRVLLQGLFSLFSRADFTPVWEEVRDRLLEELDYVREAENMRRLAQLHAGVPEIVIPAVIDEASACGVLTMEYVEGIPGSQTCSAAYSQELKDRWGAALLELQLRGIFEHRFLHADPNLANFAFREDGRVVVYDFGCVKRPPADLVAGYKTIVRAALDGRKADIPDLLLRMGVYKEGEAALADEALASEPLAREPLAREVVDPYIDLFSEILRPEPPYTFGEDAALYDKLMDLGRANLGEARDLRFPRDVVFIDRSLSGHFGNLSQLRATGPWREMVQKYVS